MPLVHYTYPQQKPLYWKIYSARHLTVPTLPWLVSLPSHKTMRAIRPSQPGIPQVFSGVQDTHKSRSHSCIRYEVVEIEVLAKVQE